MLIPATMICRSIIATSVHIFLIFLVLVVDPIDSAAAVALTNNLVTSSPTNNNNNTIAVNNTNTTSDRSNINNVTTVPIQLYGLNYNPRQGPDWDPNKCKTRTQIITDLLILRQITTRIRLLSLIDCNQGEMVLDILKKDVTGLELWLGLWVDSNSTVFEKEYDQLKIMLTNNTIDPAIVTGLTVGSEAVFRNDVTGKEIAAYQNRTKQLVQTFPLVANLPVGIVDIKDVFQKDINQKSMMNAADIIFVNVFPFWEQLPVDMAVDYLVNTKMPAFIQLAKKTYGKEVMYGETGWPSEGYSDFASVASSRNQATYFQNFYCIADRQLQWKYFYFTSIDNSWRVEQIDDPHTVEGSFGLFYANGTLKEHFQNMSIVCPHDASVQYRFMIEPVVVADPTNPPTTSAAPTSRPTPGPSTPRPTILPTQVPTTNAPTSRPTIRPTTTSPTNILTIITPVVQESMEEKTTSPTNIKETTLSPTIDNTYNPPMHNSDEKSSANQPIQQQWLIWKTMVVIYCSLYILFK